MVAGVGQDVRVASSRPLNLSTLHGDDAGAFTLDVAAQLVIGEGYDKVRTAVVVRGDDGSRLEFELGDAHAFFHEPDFFGAAIQDVEAAGFRRMSGVPVGGRLAKFIVLQKLDGDVAEGLAGNIAENRSEEHTS